MQHSIALFNSIYDKFMKQYYMKTSSLAGELDLTVRDEYYLDILFNMEQPNASKLAKKAGISKPAATQIIYRFLHQGYVDKVPSLKDKRIKDIVLRPIVRDYFEKSEQIFDELYCESLDFLSIDEKQQLEFILRKVDRNLK